jgi:2-iminoacetate synthase
MKVAKPGEIQHLCGPNAVLTFKEYLLDYATPETRELGEGTLACHLEEITNPGLKEKTQEKVQELERGKRDLYF